MTESQGEAEGGKKDFKYILAAILALSKLSRNITTHAQIRFSEKQGSELILQLLLVALWMQRGEVMNGF